MAVGIAGVHYHIGVATRDLDAAMLTLGATFGLEWAGVQEGIDGVGLVGPQGPRLDTEACRALPGWSYAHRAPRRWSQ